jgi:hypothetical protein
MPKHDVPSRRNRLLAEAALAAIVIAGTSLAPSGAAAQELGPLTRITGRSPFADCKADRAGRQEGELFRNTEIEPFIAADPTDPDNLLVGVQQDRWSNGGARGDVAEVSLDGSASWRSPNAQTINNIVVVQPNGTVIDFFTHVLPNWPALIGWSGVNVSA